MRGLGYASEYETDRASASKVDVRPTSVGSANDKSPESPISLTKCTNIVNSRIQCGTSTPGESNGEQSNQALDIVSSLHFHKHQSLWQGPRKILFIVKVEYGELAQHTSGNLRRGAHIG